MKRRKSNSGRNQSHEMYHHQSQTGHSSVKQSLFLQLKIQIFSMKKKKRTKHKKRMNMPGCTATLRVRKNYIFHDNVHT